MKFAVHIGDNFEGLKKLWKKEGLFCGSRESVKTFFSNGFKIYGKGFCVSWGMDKNISYCSKGYYESHGYKIVTLGEVLEMNKQYVIVKLDKYYIVMKKVGSFFEPAGDLKWTNIELAFAEMATRESMND